MRVTFIVALDSVDAFEGDGFAVEADSAGGPLDGSGVAADKDAVFFEASMLPHAADSGHETPKRVMADVRGCADGVVGGGVRGEGVHEALDIESMQRAEVFRNGDCDRSGHAGSLQIKDLAADFLAMKC